jgi:hypothetical protein
MALQEIMSKISVIFSLKKGNTIQKVYPKKTLSDIENGEKTKEDFNSEKQKCKYPDLELGLGPTIEADYTDIIVLQGFKTHKLVENYMSFIDTINYIHLSVIFEEGLPIYKNDI